MTFYIAGHDFSCDCQRQYAAYVATCLSNNGSEVRWLVHTMCVLVLMNACIVVPRELHDAVDCLLVFSLCVEVSWCNIVEQSPAFVVCTEETEMLV